MKSKALSYLFFISLSVFPGICLGMQVHQLSEEQIYYQIKYYETDILNCINLSIKPIQEIEEDIKLGEYITNLLLQKPWLPMNTTFEYFKYLESIKKELLTKYLNRSFINQEKNIDILGNKICKLLSSELKQEPNLWAVLEQTIQEFCIKNSCIMSPREHDLLNEHVFNISQAYTNVIREQHSHNSTPINSDYFTTQATINSTIRAIASYYKNINIKSPQTTCQAATQTEDQQEQYNVDQEVQACIERPEKIKETEQEIETALEETQKAGAEPEESVENNAENKIPKDKARITKKERQRQRRERKSPATKEAIEETVSGSIKTLEEPSATKELDDILSFKSIEKIQKQNLTKEEEEQALYELSQRSLSKGNISIALECIEKAQKTPRIMLEYIKIIAKQDSIKNHDKFFSYAKTSYSSDLTKDETQEVLQDLAKSTDNIITLSHLAKFQMDCQKSLDLLISIFHRTISSNTLPENISTILETGTYRQLIKYINEAPVDQIREYEEQIIEFIKRSVTPADANLIDENLKSLESLPLHTTKKWISLNIELLQTIYKKTGFYETQKLLIQFCIYYGYTKFCDDFIIKREELTKCIQSFDKADLEEYLDIAEKLIQKNTNNITQALLYCYRICIEKFNNIDSMRKITNILVKQKKINAECLSNHEKWLCKIIEIKQEPNISGMKDFLEQNSIQKQYIETINLIISCNPEQSNVPQELVLHYAVKHLKNDLVKFLATEHKELFLSPFFMDKNNTTSIVEAIETYINKKDDDIIDLLDITYPVNPKILDITNDYEELIIHLAAKYGSLKICKHLVEKHNANLSATNICGEKALDSAIQSKQADIVEYLYSIQKDSLNPAQIIYTFNWAVFYDSPYLLKLIFPKLLSCDGEKTISLETSIKIAIMNKYTDVLKALINQNAINIIAQQDKTKSTDSLLQDLIKYSEIQKLATLSHDAIGLKQLDEIITYLKESSDKNKIT